MAVHKDEWVELNPQYVVDSKGNKTAVVLDIEAYRAILEQLEYEADLQALKEAIAAKPTFRDWDEIEEEMRNEGEL